MMETTGPATTTGDLERVNADLARWLRTDPASLSTGAEPALADELVICGLLGGKNVGKSTLINALAQRQVSVDSADAGKGTERPMVYVHEAMRDTAAARLQAIDRCVPLDVTTHQADPIRDVVLVDLPDFDSEFLDHLHRVRAVAPLLDRVLWVVTPRKIGDRAWISLLREVVKDPTNVHCVLNKVDELLADAEPFAEPALAAVESPAGAQTDGTANDHGGTSTATARADAFWRRQDEWVSRVIERAGCPEDNEHRFLVAAAFPEPEAFVRRLGELWGDVAWTRYADDLDAVHRIARLSSQELDRLRASVLHPVSEQQRHAIKLANRNREREANVARIRRHYDLDRLTERLEQACDLTYHQQALDEVMGAAYTEDIVAGLDARLRRDTELADELLEWRVDSWPLLRLVYWPFGWLSRMAGRRLGAGVGTGAGGGDSAIRPAPFGSSRAVAVFDVGSRSLGERIEQVRSRILADHAVVAQGLGIEADLPAPETLERRVAAAADRLVPQLEDRLLEGIRRGDRRPGLLGRTALWLVLLWFPFLQPILVGLLEMFTEAGKIRFAQGMYRLVSAFSAVHLLAGLAVVAAVYIALLAGMYARCLRAVRQVRAREAVSSPIAEAVDDLIVSEVVVPLVAPFQTRLERLRDAQRRLGVAV
jgi:tRNA U34 5-carboxymethylaminomethyl modifying GTPase MnmE/TrmE